MWYYANPNKLNLPSGFPSTSNSSKYSKTLCPGFTWINQWHCWVMFSCALLAYFSGKFGLCKIPSSSPVMFLPQPNNKKRVYIKCLLMNNFWYKSTQSYSYQGYSQISSKTYLLFHLTLLEKMCISPKIPNKRLLNLCVRRLSVPPQHLKGRLQGLVMIENSICQPVLHSCFCKFDRFQPSLQRIVLV